MVEEDQCWWWVFSGNSVNELKDAGCVSKTDGFLPQVSRLVQTKKNYLSVGTQKKKKEKVSQNTGPVFRHSTSSKQIAVARLWRTLGLTLQGRTWTHKKPKFMMYS
jgi:hypothetical protein